MAPHNSRPQEVHVSTKCDYLHPEAQRRTASKNNSVLARRQNFIPFASRAEEQMYHKMRKKTAEYF